MSYDLSTAKKALHYPAYLNCASCKGFYQRAVSKYVLL